MSLLAHSSHHPLLPPPRRPLTGPTPPKFDPRMKRRIKTQLPIAEHNFSFLLQRKEKIMFRTPDSYKGEPQFLASWGPRGVPSNLTKQIPLKFYNLATFISTPFKVPSFFRVNLVQGIVPRLRHCTSFKALFSAFARKLLIKRKGGPVGRE